MSFSRKVKRVVFFFFLFEATRCLTKNFRFLALRVQMRLAALYNVVKILGKELGILFYFILFRFVNELHKFFLDIRLFLSIFLCMSRKKIYTIKLNDLI